MMMMMMIFHYHLGWARKPKKRKERKGYGYGLFYWHIAPLTSDCSPRADVGDLQKAIIKKIK